MVDGASGIRIFAGGRGVGRRARALVGGRDVQSCRWAILEANHSMGRARPADWWQPMRSTRGSGVPPAMGDELSPTDGASFSLGSENDQHRYDRSV